MKWIPKILLPISCVLLTILSLVAFSTSLETASDINPSYAIIKGNKDVSAKEINFKLTEDYFAQKRNNPKVIAWIAVPDVCYYPVMYSGDNVFYLTHDENDEYNKRGALFLNADVNKDFKQQISLVHGHHMYDGTGLAQLKKYKSEDFFQQNPYIEVFDGETLRLYKPFTVLLYKDEVQWIEQKNKTTKEHYNYMKQLYEKSEVKMKSEEKPDFNAQAIFLSTCDYSFNDARLIVGAYLVKSYRYY